MVMKTDFVVESGGHCFLCLNRITHRGGHHLPPGKLADPGLVNGLFISSLYSLQALSRYLKLDLWKVFVEDEQSCMNTVPKHILTRAEKLKLKGELCKKCACLIANFSELFRKLEKIEMEVMSSLERIHGKLLEAGEDDNTKEFRDLMNSTTDPDENLDILAVIRADTVQKCSQKLSTASPKVKFPKLTVMEMISKSKRLQSNGNSSIEPTTPPHPPQDNNENENYSGISDMESEDSMGDPTKCNSGGGRGHRLKTKKKSKGDRPVEAQKKYPFYETISSEPSAIGEQPKSTHHPHTGRHHCTRCPKDFQTLQNFRRHYETAHLKLKYRCTICEKEFAQLGHYYRHHEIIHMGVRHRCKVCDSRFAYKHHLQRHQDKYCGSRRRAANNPKTHFCHFPRCGKGFTVKYNLETHLREVHLETGKYSCDLCGRKFNRPGNLADHQRSVTCMPLVSDQQKKIDIDMT